MLVEQSFPSLELLFYPPEVVPRASIYLIGTIHRAPEKAPLLEKLLRELSPAVITVEISPFSWKVRQKFSPYWVKRFENLVKKLNLPQDHPVLCCYKEALKIPYEMEVAQRVGREKNLPVVPLDQNNLARRLLPKLLRGLSPQNLQKLGKSPPVAGIDEESLIRFLLRTGIWPKNTKEDQLREGRMSRILQRIARYRRPVVHVGGWRHLPYLKQKIPQAVGIFLCSKGGIK